MTYTGQDWGIQESHVCERIAEDSSGHLWGNGAPGMIVGEMNSSEYNNSSYMILFKEQPVTEDPFELSGIQQTHLS